MASLLLKVHCIFSQNFLRQIMTQSCQPSHPLTNFPFSTTYNDTTHTHTQMHTHRHTQTHTHTHTHTPNSFHLQCLKVVSISYHHPFISHHQAISILLNSSLVLMSNFKSSHKLHEVCIHLPPRNFSFV